MSGHKTSNRLSICALAIAAGVTWGAGVLLLGFIAMQYELGKPFVDLLASVYLGFDATVSGIFIGAAWAFVDGVIGGLIFAFVYNLVLCVCGTCCKMLCDSNEPE